MYNAEMIKSISWVKNDAMWAKLPNEAKTEVNLMLYKAWLGHKDDVLNQWARKDAYWKCECKGHIWKVAREYQSSYDEGYDVPVRCLRCGMMDM